MTRKRSARRKVPKPLIAPPLTSRKQARKITTLFHKLTKRVDEAQRQNDTKTVEKLQREIKKMGGREEYQRASKLNTRLHSTSRWVLQVLSKMDWLLGISEEEDDDEKNIYSEDEHRTRKIQKRRPCHILEIGAINTELLDAATKTKRVRVHPNKGSTEKKETEHEYQNVPFYNISVRAIDLHSSHPLIEQADFLKLPVQTDSKSENDNNNDDSSSFASMCRGVYDVIVCSMVLNSVSNPSDRGEMLQRIYLQMRPGGLCFVTLPRLCLEQSRFITRERFESLITEGIGFVIEQKKESPKIAFWVLRKPHELDCQRERIKPSVVKNRQRWSTLHEIRQGKKFRNDFSILLV